MHKINENAIPQNTVKIMEFIHSCHKSLKWFIKITYATLIIETFIDIL